MKKAELFLINLRLSEKKFVLFDLFSHGKPSDSQHTTVITVFHRLQYNAVASLRCGLQDATCHGDRCP